MFDMIPPYTGEGEKAKNPQQISEPQTGIRVSGKLVDTDTLYKLAQMGANNVEIAHWFAVPESQIRYYFSEYLEKARSALKIKLRRAQLKVAIENENPTMLIWLGKQYLGQTDSQQDTSAEQVLPWLTEQETASDEQSE